MTGLQIVQRGAAKLDEHFPGWEWEVDPLTINMKCGTYCVAGQVARAWQLQPLYQGVGLHLSVAQAMGILGHERDYGFGCQPELTIDWQTLIYAKRATAQAKVAVMSPAQLVGALILLLVTATLTWGQTVPLPDPRASFGMDLDPQFDMVYTAADGPLAGTPYVTQMKFRLVPTDPTQATRTVTVPRGQIVKSGQSLLVPDVPMPIGSFTITAAWIDGAGTEGVASNKVPFSAARQPAAAPQNFRLQGQQP